MNAKASAFHPFSHGKIHDVYAMPGLSPGARQMPGTCERCVWGRGEHSESCVSLKQWVINGVSIRFGEACLLSDLGALLETYSLQVKVRGTVWLELPLRVLPYTEVKPGSNQTMKREEELGTCLVPFLLPQPETRSPFFVEKPLHLEISFRLDVDFWYWRIFRFEPGKTYLEYQWKP